MINFDDPQIWVAISFILFFIFFGNLIWKKTSKFLDDKIETIKSDITEATNIYNEAKNLLSSETKNFQDLENKIKTILESSKTEAQELMADNKIKIHEEIKRLENSLLEKIRFIENKVIIELKNKIAEKAITQAENYLINNLKSTDQIENINYSLKEIALAIKNKKENFI